MTPNSSAFRASVVARRALYGKLDGVIGGDVGVYERADVVLIGGVRIDGAKQGLRRLSVRDAPQRNQASQREDERAKRRHVEGG